MPPARPGRMGSVAVGGDAIELVEAHVSAFQRSARSAPVSQRRQRSRGVGALRGAEQVRELGAPGHAGISWS
jgi:hypothetical protein